ncbi:MAG TPA: DUF1302 family protein [Rhizomicrobium sp.]|jgi:hypothetical protein|nr:DUF1302 family protein [Rhizomicrobium sp.]
MARLTLAAFLGASVAVLVASAAMAAELYTADGIDLRWDTTIRYSNAIRLSPQNGFLLSRANGDDGDRNFAPGLVSNRLDLSSQLDLALGDFGFHASAAGWYDSAYHNDTDNRSEATYNVTSVPSGHFAPQVRDLHGQFAELDDAFVYGTVNTGDTSLSMRLGRQTVLWGESLFYDANSIASAQAPTDYTRTLTGQSSYGTDVYLPVTQLSLTAQILPDLAVTVYDQFEARPSRQAGDGSYFSYTDFLGPGAGRFFLSSGQYLLRKDDGKISSDGQYGAAIRASLNDIDFGFYALQYNVTNPQIVMAPDPDTNDPDVAGYYRLVYPKGITLFGASASASLGDSTIAGEISLRQHMPLLPSSPAATGTASVGPQYVIGYVRSDLLHVQASDQMAIGRSDVWDSADLSAELAAEDVTEIDKGRTASLDRFAMRARLMFEPHYFQVFPNLDLTIPVGIGYNLTGHSFSYYAQNGGAGDFEIGVSALYRSAWKASVMMTAFVGSPKQQPLADRNMIVMSLERTF